MFKIISLVALMVTSFAVSMDEAYHCIIKESHRYENNDEMKCYFAKKDLFIECCVEASRSNASSVQELLEKIKQKIIRIDLPYVFLTPQDVFVRLLKNISVKLLSNKEIFPP